MSFCSIDYYLFLLFVFFSYWGLARAGRTCQKLVLLVAGYVFYAWQDWRYLPILLLVSVLAYTYGLLRDWLSTRKQAGLGAGLVLTTLFLQLGYFKYTNFLLESISSAICSLGGSVHFEPLQLLLPLGISFYVFQTSGYVIDVYRGKIEAERNPLNFFLFAGFFPSLLSGPIERADDLLLQLKQSKEFDYDQVVLGCRQMLWGSMLKMVLADNCAVVANRLLEQAGKSGAAIWLGMLFYTFQIYGDFAGYSNIAIGTAKLFGIELRKNFNYPYFSQDTVEFWQRWHITLNTWFRDYLYIPLGGSHVPYARFLFNTLLVFAFSGLWHGADLTFVIWGLYNALLVILFRPWAKRHREDLQFHPLGWKCWIRRLFHFFLIVLGWMPFRSDNLETCLDWFQRMFSPLACLSIHGLGLSMLLPKAIPWIVFLAILEFVGFVKKVEVAELLPKSLLPRWCVYGICGLVLFFFSGQNQGFIYFNF